MMPTVTNKGETFTVEFTIDCESVTDDLSCYEMKQSPLDSDAVVVIVPDVSEWLIDTLSDEQLAHHCGVNIEGLIYTNRVLF